MLKEYVHVYPRQFVDDPSSRYHLRVALRWREETRRIFPPSQFEQSDRRAVLAHRKRKRRDKHSEGEELREVLDAKANCLGLDLDGIQAAACVD